MRKKIFSLDNTWYFLLGLTLFRLVYLAINLRPLNTDEAQYWLWSQHLSWGYHSKPPLIAYAIYLTTHLFGNNYFGVRFILPVCFLVTAYFLYKAAEKLFDCEVARWVALSFLVLPSVALSATIISTDPLMLVFWAMALYFLVGSLKQNQLSSWILLGVAVGLSALSKYTGLVFLLSLVLYLIFNADVRKYLKSYNFYLMLCAVALVMLPNIIWNVRHGFATVNHVVNHNADIHGLHLHVVKSVSFVLSQLAVFSLVFMLIYGYCVWRKKYWRNQRMRLLWWLSLPMLMMIVLEALVSHAYANWAAATYLAGTILVVAILIENNAVRWLKINLQYCTFIMLAFYAVDFGVMHNIFKLKHYPRAYRELFGWENAGKQIKSLMQRYPQANFIVDSREIWAKSAYFGKIPLNKIYVWDKSNASSFEIFTSWDNAKQQDFIWLSFGEYMRYDLWSSFKNTKKLKSIILAQPVLGQRAMYAYYLNNFQGRM